MKKCKCSGNCQPQPEDLTRRKFLGLVGVGTAATILSGPAWGAFELSSSELDRWKRSLFEPATPRRYLSGQHTDARMHLGGIGTGNIEIGVDGQLTNWQLFNTLRDGQVPFYFAIRAGKTAKLLQTAGGPDWPRIQQIELTGEYPVATLQYQDGDLPVKVELEAFSPFSPLATELSSTPLAVFKFRIHNPTDQPQTVSLAALTTNPVGYAAYGEIRAGAHPSLGGNINASFREGRAAGLRFSAQMGEEPTLDRPVSLWVLKATHDLLLPPSDRPKELKIEVVDRQQFSGHSLSAPASSVIWLEDAPDNLPGPLLAELKRAVEAGAVLVLSGGTMPLLKTYATATGGKPFAEAAVRPDIVFEDFEHGYDKWTVTGEAFGTAPAHGTLPNQQPVNGFLGNGLVNSYLQGDDTTGKLTSQTFPIERHFISFLVGGGNFATTQIRLLVGGKVVRTGSGEQEEQLKPAVWEVQEFAGQTAQIEIVDEQKGGWGHINVDQIVFTDRIPGRELVQLLDTLLPIRFSAVDPVAGQTEDFSRVAFRDEVLNSNGQKADLNSNGLEQFTRAVGAGKVVLFAGQLLNPAHADSPRLRQRAYATLCDLVGANYTTSAPGQSPKAAGFGSLALAVLANDITGLTSFKDWGEAWKQFQEQGRFLPLQSLPPSAPSPAGQTVHGALAATVTVPAGSTWEIPFLLTWHYPNNYYDNSGDWIGRYYTTRWPDAQAVMRDAIANYNGWHQQTALFRETFYDSTLPYWLLDCITSNAAILRHIGVVFRIANGDIYGYEGSNGCCGPTCTHVWGYEQSLAYLFPDLEKQMRQIDYFHQQAADGGIHNRTAVPSPPFPTGEPPFADGHASCILKAYREALNSSDDAFAIQYWPKVKQAVEYLIMRDAKGAAGQPDGVLRDDQQNTYDEALHGVTSFISGYYLAALRAGEEWARRLGDTATADRFHAIFERGQQKLVELCWNGEYFQQYLPDYMQRQGEVGPGCMSDQLIGQWWAHQLGLGYILPQDKVVSALKSVFKYNWKSDLTGWKHVPRAFAGAQDQGLIICTWPKGGRPDGVMLYSDEVWTGIEYQVAAHLIYEGLLEAGFAVIKGARDRYDGIPRPPIGRNPWCEIECGGHYARAMSSWSLLRALAGFEYDGPRQALRFAPGYQPEHFKGFFTAPEGWGSLAQKVDGTNQRIEIAVKSGKLPVKTLELAGIRGMTPHNVTALLAGKAIPAALTMDGTRWHLTFDASGMIVHDGEKLEITLS